LTAKGITDADKRQRLEGVAEIRWSLEDHVEKAVRIGGDGTPKRWLNAD
jgi:hypothetical protein